MQPFSVPVVWTLIRSCPLSSRVGRLGDDGTTPVDCTAVLGLRESSWGMLLYVFSVTLRRRREVRFSADKTQLVVSVYLHIIPLCSSVLHRELVKQSSRGSICPPCELTINQQRHDTTNRLIPDTKSFRQDLIRWMLLVCHPCGAIGTEKNEKHKTFYGHYV